MIRLEYISVHDYSTLCDFHLLYFSSSKSTYLLLRTILWKLYHFVTPVPFCDKTVPFCDTCTILWQSWTILWQTKLYHFVTPIVPFCVKKKLYHFVTKSYHFMNYEFLLAKSDTFRKFPNFRFINGNFYWFYVQLTLNRLSSCKINTILSRDQSTMAYEWNWLADKIELSRVREIWD